MTPQGPTLLSDLKVGDKVDLPGGGTAKIKALHHTTQRSQIRVGLNHRAKRKAPPSALLTIPGDLDLTVHSIRAVETTDEARALAKATAYSPRGLMLAVEGFASAFSLYVDPEGFVKITGFSPNGLDDNTWPVLDLPERDRFLVTEQGVILRANGLPDPDRITLSGVEIGDIIDTPAAPELSAPLPNSAASVPGVEEPAPRQLATEVFRPVAVYTAKQRLILDARALSDTPITLEEFAQQHSISRTRATQIETRAIEIYNKHVGIDLGELPAERPDIRVTGTAKRGRAGHRVSPSKPTPATEGEKRILAAKRRQLAATRQAGSKPQRNPTPND